MKLAINSEYGLAKVLGAACLLLVLVAVVEWRVINNRGEISDAGAMDPGTLAVNLNNDSSNEFVLEGLDSLTETVERPLFVSTRKPLEVDGDGAENTPLAVTATKMTSKVMGIYSGEKGLMALIMDAKGNYYRSAQGDEVDGWRVKELYDDRVVVVQGRQREELILRKPKPKKAAVRRPRASERKSRIPRKKATPKEAPAIIPPENPFE